MAGRAKRKAGRSALIVALSVVVLALAGLIAWRTLGRADAPGAPDLDLTPPVTVPEAPLAPLPR